METIKHINLSTTKLEPKDILGWRGDKKSGYMEHMFFNNVIYDKIKESIQTKDITLIIGNPLSGKTRIVFDSIKSNNDWNIIIPKKSKVAEGYILPTSINNMIVLLDDVDDYCKEDNPSLNKLLKHIINSNIKCVITCRRGPEFDRFKKYLNHQIRTRLFLNKYHIEKFDKSNPAVRDFLLSNKENFKSDIRNFDGNFGSIVLPLDTMRERFSKLKEEEEREIPFSILLGLKLHYHLLNYEDSKSTFGDDKIKNFCIKYTGREITMYEWEEAKNILESTETDLNFIKSESSIQIEEAYIDFLYDSNGNSFDVVYNFSEKQIHSLFNKLYKPEEKQPWGFPVTTRDLNLLIKKSTSFREGKEIFKKIPELERDSFSYTYLMNLCVEKTELLALYKELKKSGINTLFVPNSTFVSKLETFIDLYDSLKELEPRLLEYRNGATNRLLNLAELNPEETLNYLFLKEPKIKIYKNPVFNQVLLLCCSKNEHFEQYLKPAISILDHLDYTLKKNIIKNIIKLKLYDIAIPLVEKHLLNYDYYNELANCKKESDPQESLSNYTKSLGYIEFISQEQKTLTNINKIILSNPAIVSQKDLKEILSKTHQFLKSKKKELLKLRNTDYLKEALLLNEIQLTDSSVVMTRLEELYRLDYLSKKTFPKLVDQIIDENKSLVFSDFLNKTTANIGIANSGAGH